MPTLLNDCGCCEGITAIVPELLFNRPGLAQVRYRIGTHGEFLASALVALSDPDPKFAALRSLTTRDLDDFTIALLDGWATLADVLTFYQERIANEFWLRTATERDSILRLAQLIGYRLKAGGGRRDAAQISTSTKLPARRRRSQSRSARKCRAFPARTKSRRLSRRSSNSRRGVEWNALKPGR